MCHSEAEDVRHALFACSHARQVWSALGIEQEIESLLAVDRSGSIVIQEAIRRRTSYALEQYWSSGTYFDRVVVYLVATKTICSWRGHPVTTMVDSVHCRDHNDL
jgi:hypothetical protein